VEAQRQRIMKTKNERTPRAAQSGNDLEDAPSIPRSARDKLVGTVALVGRPNAGKSTLLNRILGQKVSIVSEKPQTTRNRIVGILNEARGQIAFLDTPGIHRPLHKLNVRMMDHVRAAFDEADVIALIVDAGEPFGRGDEYVIEMLRQTQTPKFAILNKIDTIKKQKLLPLMQHYGSFGLFDEIIPISAAKGDGIDSLLSLLFARMPEGPAIYPIGDFTTQPERFYAAEIVREKVLHHTSDKLPYTTAVHVDRFEEEEAKNLIKIYATIFVERETQKPIIIGKAGERIKQIGTEARLDLESFLGAKVFLDLHVGVHERWREDERFLGDLDWPLL
jgi:GTP-binding protein Era